MKKYLIVFGLIIFLLFSAALFFHWSAQIDDPNYSLDQFSELSVNTIDQRLFYTNNGWYQKNDLGLNEIYIEGNPFELGYNRGLLSEHLIYKQEKLFVDKIKTMIPSTLYLYILKEVVAWFNKDLPEYLIPSLDKELFSISRFAADEFDFVGSKYQRVLNYHAAHDIGHALENYELVGCTSFSTWGEKSDGLIVARNFDFSMGEKFAAEKVISFYNPDDGIAFAMITWSDFIGCVSGMNTQGLTVTINAGENEIPTELGTPISLIAREVLQYANNINEAFEIVSKRKSFVSESILIGSANDNKTAIIEKTPDTTILVHSEGNTIVCSNHFLSDELKKSPKEHIESASRYRYKKIENELNAVDTFSIYSSAKLLRSINGIDNVDIGMGNEKSINQFVAHHGIIFKPLEKKLWVSTPPYQMGEMICYDLNKVFTHYTELEEKTVIYNVGENISKDSVLNSQRYSDFKQWRQIRVIIERAIQEDQIVETKILEVFADLNKSYFKTYEIIGDYYKAKGQLENAKQYYNLALSKELPYESDFLRLEESVKNSSD